VNTTGTAAMSEPHDLHDPSLRDRAVRAARGQERFDVLLIGGMVADVATGELRSADVGLVGPLIASVHPSGGRSDALEQIVLNGRIIAPGLIDSHLHIESSMVTPRRYAEVVVPQGTTTICWDPHEIGNVAGLDGLRWAIEATTNLPLRIVVLAPSCVPSAPGLERTGADFGPDEMREMLRWPAIAGVAEVMDMRSLLERQQRMCGIVDAGLASGKLVCGHARGLTGADLQGFAAAGIESDHEITSGDDLLAKLRAGFTLNAAMRLGRRDLGVIAPGRRADIIVLSDLTELAVSHVFASGAPVAVDGRLVVALPPNPHGAPLGTMQVPMLSPDDFILRPSGANTGRVRLRTVAKPRFTEWGEVVAEVSDGAIVLPDDAILMAVVHRHGKAPATPVLGVLQGWSTWRGALATSVAHDSHNLVVFGRDPADLAAAANAVIAAGGGMAVATRGAVAALLKLPLCGLLSDVHGIDVAAEFRALREAADAIVDWQPPLLTFKSVVGAALACNPGPHVTDCGIADGSTGDVFANVLIGAA
jgi:adenine deaminase